MAGAERLSSSLKFVQRSICGGRIRKQELPAAAPIACNFWLKSQASQSLWSVKVQLSFLRACYFWLLLQTARYLAAQPGAA